MIELTARRILNAIEGGDIESIRGRFDANSNATVANAAAVEAIQIVHAVQVRTRFDFAPSAPYRGPGKVSAQRRRWPTVMQPPERTRLATGGQNGSQVPRGLKSI